MSEANAAAGDLDLSLLARRRGDLFFAMLEPFPSDFAEALRFEREEETAFRDRDDAAFPVLFFSVFFFGVLPDAFFFAMPAPHAQYFESVAIPGEQESG